MGRPKTSAPKRELPYLKVYVSREERHAIKKNAAQANVSVSAFLREAALGHTFRSTFDHDAVLALSKINGDMGRLGGLLKMWLAGTPDKGMPVTDIRRLVADINELRHKMLDAVQRLG